MSANPRSLYELSVSHAQSIVCIEDVDASQKRELDLGQSGVMQPKAGSRKFDVPSGGQVSLSSMLNAIDGVEANEGR